MNMQMRRWVSRLCFQERLRVMGSLPPSEEKCHVPGLKINKKPGCRERPALSDPKELRDPLAPRFQGGVYPCPPPTLRGYLRGFCPFWALKAQREPPETSPRSGAEGWLPPGRGGLERGVRLGGGPMGIWGGSR